LLHLLLAFEEEVEVGTRQAGRERQRQLGSRIYSDGGNTSPEILRSEIDCVGFLPYRISSWPPCPAARPPEKGFFSMKIVK
jgi:hypothetical protein